MSLEAIVRLLALNAGSSRFNPQSDSIIPKMKKKMVPVVLLFRTQHEKALPQLEVIPSLRALWKIDSN